MSRAKPHQRRGVAIIIVLAMISVAMAISYAMMRSQTIAVQVQQNGDRRGSARNAAMAGLANAIRKMHTSSWGGVGTTLTGTLSSYDTYSATFTAGDDSLSSTSANYSDWHFRVTVVSTGTSVSPVNSQVKATYKVKAVLQLVPKQLYAEPTNWSLVRQNTIYQTNTGQFSMDVPGRVEGAMRLQGTVSLGANYNWSSTARSRYLSDLNAMRTARNEVQTVTVSNATGGTYRLTFNGATTGSIAYDATASTLQTTLRGLSSVGNSNVNVGGNIGGPYTVTFVNSLGSQDVQQMTVFSNALTGTSPSVGVSLTTQGWPGYADCRPIIGPVSLPTSSTDATNLSLISSLGVTTTNISVGTPMSVSLPQTLATYRIYTGGPTYNVPQVSSSLANITLTPDPTTNPLGIYFCGSTLSLGDNVNVTGTLISGSGMNINGPTVNFSPVSLKPLDGTTTPIRLPAAVARQVFYVNTTVTATINGFLVAGDQFCLERGLASSVFAVTGRLVTNEFILRDRSDWDFASLVWTTLWSLFSSQQSTSNGTPFYPIYLNSVGCNPNPLLTIKPDTSSLFEHWQDLSQPIYVAATGDPGLVWDVLRVVADP